MTDAKRRRFHNLLLMAKESPFEGERRNALRAAERLASGHGMTLDEAARSGGEEYQQPTPRPPPSRSRAYAGMARFMEDVEARLRNDKARYAEALKAAYARGLDARDRKRDGRRTAAYHGPRPRPPRRRAPLAHARVLLTDTRLPLAEVASIAGLDIWTVAGLKLKLRAQAAKP